MDSTEDKKEGTPVTAVPTNTAADGASLTHENTKPNAAGDSNPLSGAGALLRSMRERSGVSTAVLAAGLKVSVRKIEALEDERWQDLPDLVFARALAASFCRYLHADKSSAEQVLSCMPSAGVDKVDLGSVPESGVEMPSSQPGGFGKFSGKTLWLLLVILLLTLVMYFFPNKNVLSDWSQWVSSTLQMQAVEELSTNTDATEARTSSAADQGQAEKSEQEAVTVADVDAVNAEDSTLVVTSAATDVSSVETDAKQVTLVPAESDQTKTASSTDQRQEQPLSEEVSSDNDDVLRLKADEDSWIGISELAADGKRKNRLLKVGESMSLPKDFVLPVKVTIGNAQATQAEVRGKVLDLSTVSKGNVARFEIE